MAVLCLKHVWSPVVGRSGHNSDADLDVVLDFLRDQIAVKKEFLRIASMAKSDEPYKEDERQLSKDAKEIDAEIKDATDAWPILAKPVVQCGISPPEDHYIKRNSKNT